MKQVGATANGVKVKWSAVKGATGYYVLLRPSGGGSDGEYKTIAKTKATQYTLKNLSKKNTHYDVAIKPYRNVADSKNLVTSVAALNPISCVTTPAAPKAVCFSRYSSFDGNDDHTAAEISWTTVSSKENTDGYQIQIYQVNKNGKDKLIRNIHKKGHHNSEDRSNSPVVYGYHFQEYKAAYLTHIIKVRVRGYVNLNGKKQYGPWSAYDTLIPGAHVKRHNVEFHSKVKNGKLRLNWFKVTGAKYYNIYRKLTLDGKSTKWKKVASKVKGSSAMVPNKPGYYNVYYVQPCGMKMGKKKVNGPKPAKAQDIIMIYPIS